MDSFDTTGEVRQVVAAEMTALVQHWVDTLADYNGLPFDTWLLDGLKWYLGRGAEDA